MSAVGKNLSFQAVIAAGGHVSTNMAAPLSEDKKNINFPVINKKDGVKT